MRVRNKALGCTTRDPHHEDGPKSDDVAEFFSSFDVLLPPGAQVCERASRSTMIVHPVVHVTIGEAFRWCHDGDGNFVWCPVLLGREVIEVELWLYSEVDHLVEDFGAELQHVIDRVELDCVFAQHRGLHIASRWVRYQKHDSKSPVRDKEYIDKIV